MDKENIEDKPDPRIEQLRKTAHELIIERAQMGISAFKQDGNLYRAMMFFEEAKNADTALNQLLEALGHPEPSVGPALTYD